MSLKGHQNISVTRGIFKFLRTPLFSILPYLSPLYVQLALRNFFLCFFSDMNRKWRSCTIYWKTRRKKLENRNFNSGCGFFWVLFFSLFYTFWTIVHQWDQWYPYFRIELTHLHISCRPVNSSCLKLFCVREIWGLMGVVPKKGFCTQFCHVHLHKLLLFMRLQTQNLK